MRDFHVTVMYEDGSYSNTTHLKAINKSEVISRVLADEYKSADEIISITVIEAR